jgi:hypothetical protein
MTKNDDELQGSDRPPVEAGDSSDAEHQHPEQVHPEQEAHGGSMAPDLVDNAGRPVEESQPAATVRAGARTPAA